MIDANVSISINKDSFLAGKEVAKEALSGMSSKPKLAILAVDHLTKTKFNYQEVVNGLRSELDPSIPMIGSTVNGILVNDRFALKSVGLMLLGGDIDTEPVFNYGRSRLEYPKIAEELINMKQNLPNPKEKVLLLFEDGMKFPLELLDQQKQLNSPLVSKMTGIVKKSFIKQFKKFAEKGIGNPPVQELVEQLYKNGWDVPIIGNLATNQVDFISYEFFNDKVEEDAILGTFISGTNGNKIGFGFGAGAKPTGIKCSITKSIGNFFLKINKKPALEGFTQAVNLELESLEELAPQSYLNLYHMFGTTEKVGDKTYHHLTATVTDPSLKNLVISGFPFQKVPEEIEIFESSLQALLETTESAINDAKEGIDDPRFLLGIDCIVRWSSYGDNITKAIKKIDDTIGKDVPRMVIGSGGEVFGTKADDYYLNNMTFLTLVGGK